MMSLLQFHLPSCRVDLASSEVDTATSIDLESSLLMVRSDDNLVVVDYDSEVVDVVVDHCLVSYEYDHAHPSSLHHHPRELDDQAVDEDRTYSDDIRTEIEYHQGREGLDSVQSCHRRYRLA